MRRWQHETTKAIVAVAVEVHEPKGFGRIRLQRVPQASEKYLLAFISDVIHPGTVVHTDGSPIYRLLPERGYVPKRSVITGSDTPANVSMPAVHRVSSLLKRWLLGIHQGSVQPHQLDYYLDEYTFRFNRRHFALAVSGGAKVDHGSGGTVPLRRSKTLPVCEPFPVTGRVGGCIPWSCIARSVWRAGTG